MITHETKYSDDDFSESMMKQFPTSTSDEVSEMTRQGVHIRTDQSQETLRPVNTVAKNYDYQAKRRNDHYTSYDGREADGSKAHNDDDDSLQAESFHTANMKYDNQSSCSSSTSADDTLYAVENAASNRNGNNDLSSFSKNDDLNNSFFSVESGSCSSSWDSYQETRSNKTREERTTQQPEKINQAMKLRPQKGRHADVKQYHKGSAMELLCTDDVASAAHPSKPYKRERVRLVARHSTPVRLDMKEKKVVNTRGGRDAAKQVIPAPPIQLNDVPINTEDANLEAKDVNVETKNVALKPSPAKHPTIEKEEDVYSSPMLDETDEIRHDGAKDQVPDIEELIKNAKKKKKRPSLVPDSDLQQKLQQAEAHKGQTEYLDEEQQPVAHDKNCVTNELYEVPHISELLKDAPKKKRNASKPGSMIPEITELLKNSKKKKAKEPKRPEHEQDEDVPNIKELLKGFSKKKCKPENSHAPLIVPSCSIPKYSEPKTVRQPDPVTKERERVVPRHGLTGYRTVRRQSAAFRPGQLPMSVQKRESTTKKVDIEAPAGKSMVLQHAVEITKTRIYEEAAH